MLDAQKPLELLNSEWSGCTSCELGVSRIERGKSFVCGEGTKNAIMFIGEGPGRNEEEEGRPFVGKSGELLRKILDGYKVSDYYITNIVSCRGCEPVLDEFGQPKLIKRRRGPDLIMYADIPPTPSQMAACSARLYEEIYIVDPVIIVTLGATASNFILGRKFSITRDRGTSQVCQIPGSLHRPSTTEKRKAWLRKVHGTVVSPIEQNNVDYLVIPTLHPAFVSRKEHDYGKDSPFNQLAMDIKLAAEIYDMYMYEFYGREPMQRTQDPLEREVSDEAENY